MPKTEAAAPDLPVIAMLGTGNLSGALLAGLTRPGTTLAAPIRATTRSQASADRYSGQAGVEAVSLESDPEANRAAVRGAQLVIVGVKPHLVRELLAEIAGDLEPGAALISVAAGVTLATIESLVPAGIRAIRAMPNTPASVGLGVTGYAPGSAADAESLAWAKVIFDAVGTSLLIDESQIDALAAVSGSGPAHVFLLMEAGIAAARRLGFDAQQSRILVEGTFLGASTLSAKSPGTEISELRRRVTSPKGTTERSVAVLEQADLGGLFDRAFAANIARSIELAAE